MRKILLSIAVIILSVIQIKAQVVSNSLQAQLNQLPAGGTVPAWVYLSDRGLSAAEMSAALEGLRQNMPDRTIARREKCGLNGFSPEDLPVNPVYYEQVKNITGKIRASSRYFNAVSVNLNFQTAQVLAGLSFVKRMEPVARFHRDEPFVKGSPNRQVDLNYGESYEQLEQINVIAMHDMGFSGAGVWVGMLDTGFNLQHIVFAEMQIEATWDFINGDSIVSNQPGDPPTQHNHGTYTASACGGRLDYMMYGPAYGAHFMLGKTEMSEQEIPIEEDYYVAGLEWADSAGCDVVSTSLGYCDWYTFEQLDGNTTVTAIAVDIAVSHGVCCVTAAGNYRNYPQFPHIITPADADSVISVGAVDLEGELASFSSPGPTADGRIKPEICADGVDVYCANPYNATGFTNVDGTSLSTPLVGGSVALILEAHPGWTPMQVREALMMTADNANHPNNDYGWGIIDVLAAAEDFNQTPSIIGVSPAEDTVNVWADSTVVFTIDAEDGDNDPLTYIFRVDGAIVDANETGIFDYISHIPETVSISIEVFDLLGAADTTFWTVIVQPFNGVGGQQEVPTDFGLNVYPNPFNQRVTIEFDLPEAGEVSMKVYDIAGREVQSLVTGHSSLGKHSVVWDAEECGSGVYFVRLEADGYVLTQKVVLMK